MKSRQQGHRNMWTHHSRILIMIGFHFIAMYILMYSMVNVFDNVFHSFNQVYMAALMTASMVLIELPLMSSMYKSKRLNAVIMALGVAMLIGSFVLIRKQTLISRSGPTTNPSRFLKAGTLTMVGRITVIITCYLR